MRNRLKPQVVLLVAALALSSGCLKDGIGGAPGIDPDSTPVDIETRAAIGSVVNGITLNSVRVIAVTRPSGLVVFNKYRDAYSEELEFEDAGLGSERAGNFIVSIRPGEYDFYTIINELPSQKAALGGVMWRADLQAVKFYTAEMPAEASMVCTGEAINVTVLRPASEGDPPQVIVNGGAPSSTLSIQPVRVAARLKMEVRKRTDTGDTFSITGAALSSLPQYSFLLPGKAYDGSGYINNVTLPVKNNAVAIPGDNTFVDVVDWYILPEYLMQNPAGDANAVKLRLTANQRIGGGATEVLTYEATLLGTQDSRDMERNKQYFVSVTINDRYTPYITYETAKWETVGGDVSIGDDVITTSSRWATGTRYESGSNDNTVLVANNGSVTYEFILSNPQTALWTAHLTNTSDFEFDTAGDVGGTAQNGTVNRITIRPKGEVSASVSTEFYITVYDGVRDVEIDINGVDGTVGTGHRYIIKQIPN